MSRHAWRDLDRHPFVRSAESAGWKLRRSKGGHVLFYRPGDGRLVASLGADVGDRHAERNTRAQLRRHGLDV